MRPDQGFPAKKTGNLRACQFLRGHIELKSTLGVKVDDALEMSESLEL
jgi:hypothetical protein